MELDYAGPRGVPGWEVVEVGAWVVFWVLAVVGYAFACGPAIHQRGYPPIDPHVQARVFLWMLPIGVSALFTWLTPVRVKWLVIYALLTAYSDASSWPVSVPNYIPMFERLPRIVVLFGPLHLMVAVVVEGASRAMRGLILSVRRGDRLKNVLLGAVAVLMVRRACRFPDCMPGRISGVCRRRGCGARIVTGRRGSW
jgi:hypothetical protein